MINREDYYSRLYNKARRIIGDHTPLKVDCGQLCNGACCQGDDETGMILFPHEKTKFSIKTGDGYDLAICDGKCQRSERPLSCMIFPFFPVIDKDGNIEVKPDLRGKAICPMLSYMDQIQFDRVFLRRVARVGRILSRDRECRDLMMQISEEIRLAESWYGG